ncbi:MAG: right-handed parallel beta-helix repeat-containing protein [Polyangiaceae bacterium]
MHLRLAALLSATLLAACSDGGDASDGSTGTGCDAEICNQPTGTCADGFIEVPGVGCEPLLAADPCPTGTRPAIGSDACLPVGVSACPQGFSPDPLGWGCAEVLPAASCAGATREVLGETTCQPVGDCDAPFPPADATLFVSAAYGPQDLDATHFATIVDALAAAGPGEVIAVDSGVYPDSLVVVEDGVTIAGRCAAEVRIQGEAGSADALFLDSATDLMVRGLTIAGFEASVIADGTRLTLEDVVIDGNRWVAVGALWKDGEIVLRRSVVRDTTRGSQPGPTHGVLAGRQARITLEDSVLSDNLYAALVADEGGQVTVLRSVIRGTRPEPDGPYAGIAGYGVVVTKGSEATVVESAIVDNQSSGLGVTSAYSGVYSRATITRSVVGRTTMNALGGARAVEAADGAELVVEDSTLVQSEETQIIAEQPGTTLRLTDVVVRGPIDDDGGDSGPGVIVGDGATADIQRTAFVGNRVMGIYMHLGGAMTLRESLVQGTLPSRGGSLFGDAHFGIGAAVLPGTRLDAVDTAFVGNREMSLFVRGQGAAVTLDRVLVADTLYDAGDGYGRGINVQDGASLAAVQTAVLRGTEVGVVSFGSFVTLTDSTIGHTTRGAEDVLAIGVVAALGGRVELLGSTITGNQDVGLIIAASSAYVNGGFVSNNAIGAHVQDGSSLLVDEAPSGDAMTCVFSPDTSFVGNATRIGSGEVPLPMPVASEGP